MSFGKRLNWIKAMPVEISTTRDGSIAIAYCFGKLTEANVTESVAFAFGERQIRPSMDRIVKLDPAVELHELEYDTLQRIQRRVLDHELQDGGEVSFRSCLVHSSPLQKILLDLYKAIWDELALPGVEFLVVASEDEAWKALGLKPAVRQSGTD